MNELQPVMDLIPHKLLVVIFAVVAISRFANKWWSAPLQAKLTRMMVEAATSPDAEQERDWETVLRWRPYRILNFTLDLFLSVKLPVLADFLRAKAQGQQNNNPPEPSSPANTGTK